MAIISNSTQHVPSWEAASFSVKLQSIIPAVYIICRINTEEIAGGLEDTFLYRKLYPSLCAGPPASSTCVSKTQQAGRIWHWNRTIRMPGELQASDRISLIFISLRGILRIVKCIYTWSQQRIQWHTNTISLFCKTQYTILQQYKTIRGTTKQLKFTAYGIKTTPFTVRSIHREVRSIYRVLQNAAGSQCCWQVTSRYGRL